MILVRLEHPLKALEPIEVTLLGILILIKFVQDLNAPSLMVVRLPWMLTLFRLVQL